MVPEYREEAKKRIVEAGLEVMYEKGYCRTTMEDIAKHLNVSKPALYRYFKNKDELILESAKILQGQYRKITTPQSPERCPVATWIEIFDRMMSSDLNEHALLLEIFAMTAREPVLGNFSRERMKNGIDQPAQAIAKQQQEGLISPATDPRTLAIALVSMFNGMRVMILLGVDRDELRSRWIEIVRALFRGQGSGDVAMECPPDCAGCEVRTRARRAE
ncbi:helix-turn-helix domain-containing protein [Methanofollis sp. UBA420]|jgi:AcrR family transcriptional regulator|uniref:TetR/AcrR family transcriptional regulator n=1 Tax=Methanofollis sp. UBA420 TaxID=1915514 RepID=UPI00316AD1BB